MEWPRIGSVLEGGGGVLQLIIFNLPGKSIFGVLEKLYESPTLLFNLLFRQFNTANDF